MTSPLPFSILLTWCLVCFFSFTISFEFLSQSKRRFWRFEVRRKRGKEYLLNRKFLEPGTTYLTMRSLSLFAPVSLSRRGGCYLGTGLDGFQFIFQGRV
ncbi:hypothetical protein GGS20DRAFT_264937 [Poronia punctata]|nr:hypothetical protein GGS20DRAFT_264937 [Poronia punctata]